MPLSKEFRLFFLDGQVLYSTEYWAQGDYQGMIPPVDQFVDVAKAVKSRFFTMDIAKRVDGAWMIVELGDAQVAGLPENADVLEFYSRLKQHGLHPV
jgi:ATP-grasp domain, R2K clade family 3